MQKNRKQIRAISLALLIGLTFLWACQDGSSDRELLVFAASSLTESFQEIEEVFESDYPAVDVILNLGSSSALRTQIEEGAQADIYVSANLAHMQTLVDEGFVDVDAPQLITSNEIGLIVPENNPAGIKNIEDLARPGVRLVLALPEVPAGDYARKAIESLGELFGSEYTDAVMRNIVSNEDTVKQVLFKVELGEADAGFVYRSDALVAQGIHWLSLPMGYRPAVSYTMSVVNTANDAEEAKQFLNFILSSQGQAILGEWGFSQIKIEEENTTKQ